MSFKELAMHVPSKRWSNAGLWSPLLATASHCARSALVERTSDSQEDRTHITQMLR